MPHSFWTTIGNSHHSGVPNVAKLQRKDCSPYLYCLLIVQDLKTIFVLHTIYLSRPSVVRPSKVFPLHIPNVLADWAD